MSHCIFELKDKGLIEPPSWLPNNTMYLTIMGSIAYGVAEDSSDYDVYGWCIPPKEYIFQHFAGVVHGWDRQIKEFNQWQQHHIKDENALGGRGRNYDFAVHNIVKYFRLVADNNPNMVDSLFVPQNCILHSTAISERVRDNRNIFLSKKCWHSFKGYAYSQLHKARSKNPTGKRKELRQIHGMDTKFLYHVVRLVSECEQILVEGDLDLQEKGRREHMKAIRRGEVSQEDVEKWFTEKERNLEKLYNESKLPWGPNEAKIKQLLLECLESHYGSIDKAYKDPEAGKELFKEIESVLENFRNKL